MNGPTTGLYVHVPFCARTCDYCAFYQGAPDAASIRRYLAGIAREGELVSWPERIATVFWGGGTPGLLSAADLGRLAELTRRHCGGAPAEWSVEMTPLSVTEARLAALREAGVTRLSLGVQSFQPRLLKALGRDHSPEQAYRAVERARAAGFDNINLDMMFALPGQSDEDWMQDLGEAIALGPEHISTYCLTFEEDTRLWLKLSEGRLRRDVDAEARLYEATWERLAASGHAQYEISNFARPGRECIHNVNTWRMHSWAGLGPSAASQQHGRRGSNAADLDRWLEGLGRGVRADEEASELTPGLLAEDALIFGLRMNAGVDTAPWRALAGSSSWETADRVLGELAGEGLCVVTGSRIQLSARGRLLADAVGSRLLGTLSA